MSHNFDIDACAVMTDEELEKLLEDKGLIRNRSKNRDENRQLQYLYTIARNLCRQHYRDLTIKGTLEEQEDIPASESFEQPLLEQIVLLSVIT